MQLQEHYIINTKYVDHKVKVHVICMFGHKVLFVINYGNKTSHYVVEHVFGYHILPLLPILVLMPSALRSEAFSECDSFCSDQEEMDGE